MDRAPQSPAADYKFFAVVELSNDLAYIYVQISLQNSHLLLNGRTFTGS